MLGTPRFFVIRVDIVKFGRTWSFIQSNIPQLALTTLSHRERFLCVGYSRWLTEANISSPTFPKSSISLAKLCSCTLFIFCDPPALASFVITLKRYVDRTTEGSVPNIARYGHLFLFTLRWEDLFPSNWKTSCPLRVTDLFLQGFQHIFQTSARSFNWRYGKF